ncbi:hypothetical protein BDV29DRAFT_180712 [Aspergillus leporis]|uniref:Uncharacterized protein n=1 Tax=Aspergillus leporis TaxID=41062 RepID=A0A5N5WS83_9EURO|nr:hypothetical protein BDV29DRAFT_180712 [Aspergillus leporis]
MSPMSNRVFLPLYASLRNSSVRIQRLNRITQTHTLPRKPFSTHHSLANRRSPPNDSNEPPQLPTLSFEGLGISKGTKAFLIVILCCFGTMETWFWCKTIWRWWKGDAEDVGPVQATK